MEQSVEEAGVGIAVVYQNELNQATLCAGAPSSSG